MTIVFWGKSSFRFWWCALGILSIVCLILSPEVAECHCCFQTPDPAASGLSPSQDNSPAIDQAEIGIVIKAAAKLVEEYYVSEKVGMEIADHIRAKNKAGEYRNCVSPDDFARQLTIDLRSINGDLHMSASHRPIGASPRSAEDAKRVDKSGQWTNYGFQEIKVLSGNVGYLKINHFTNWGHFEEAKKVVTKSINALNSTDALIIDVRDNGGGFEEIVAYLISHFYDGRSLHLADYYYRYNDERRGVFTTVDLPGTKIPNTPIFILVNKKTGSAAESLAYTMKHLKRATIIGEKTAGAGHGAMNHRVNERFLVQIASETTINAVTKTSFQTIGVVPNVNVASEDAFTEGYRRALKKIQSNNKDSIDSSNYDRLIEKLKE